MGRWRAIITNPPDPQQKGNMQVVKERIKTVRDKEGRRETCEQQLRRMCKRIADDITEKAITRYNGYETEHDEDDEGNDETPKTTTTKATLQRHRGKNEKNDAKTTKIAEMLGKLFETV